MVVNIETYDKDIMEYSRNLLQNDSELATLLSTATVILTTPMTDNIFVGRPVNQKKGFRNPRIVLEAPIKLPGNVGDNPDAYQESEMTFQISGWVDNNPWELNLNVKNRIEKIFDNINYQPYKGSNPSGVGHFKVNSTDSNLDPDKDNTYQVTILVRAFITIDG